MKRRHFLQMGFAAWLGTPLMAALRQERLDEATEVLAKAVARGQVSAAVLHVVQRETAFTRHFGKAVSEDAMFLLGSVSKPVCVTALMTLFDRGEFQLDDPLEKFLPKLTGTGRDRMTLRHLLTHASGLPDQLPENNTLRKNHAGLGEFVEHAIRTPLQGPLIVHVALCEILDPVAGISRGVLEGQQCGRRACESCLIIHGDHSSKLNNII